MPAIGVDIGGSKIRGILWNGKRVIQAHEFPTPKNKNDFKKRLVALISLLSRQKPVVGIGIGAAGIVEKTTLLFSPNIPYIKRFDFRSLCPRSLPLQMDNDARSFARAEFLQGAGRGSASLFGLTIGTGVGRAYGKNGRVIKIKKFEYPERWERRYQAIRDRGDDRRLAKFLGEKLAALMKSFRPAVVVIGGGVMRRRGFLTKLQAELKAHGLACKLRRSAFGKDAAALGAALLFNNFPTINSD